MMVVEQLDGRETGQDGGNRKEGCEEWRSGRNELKMKMIVGGLGRKEGRNEWKGRS
jgi:hypothetical protein